MDDKLKHLIEYIARNVFVSSMSVWTPVPPVWSVEAYGLLDEIAKTFEITQDEIGAIVNPIREEIEGS